MKRSKEYRALAWNIFNQDLGKIFLFSLLSTIVLMAIGGTGFGFFILGPFYVGTMLYYLRAIRKEELGYGALFEPITKNDIIRTIILYILKILFIFLWTLLFFIPGIIKSYSYAMAEFIAIDNPNMSAEDCITQSRKMMKGYKFKLFLLDLSFIGWWILAVVIIFVGAVFFQAYHTMARAAFYEDLKAKYNA
ncbi:MAG TPA: DUF975 family protein [Clostridiales bacterium]|nr:DUF975 family protein [Clostridiales bacterium]